MRAQGGMFVAGASRRRSHVVAAVKRLGRLGWRGAEHEPPSTGRESSNATSGEALQSRATGWAGLALLVAVAVGLFGQGAYHPPVQRPVGVLIAVATVLSLAVWPPSMGELAVGGGARPPPLTGVVGLLRSACPDRACHARRDSRVLPSASASSRSAHERTVPLRITLSPSTSVTIRSASVSALRTRASSILRFSSYLATGPRPGKRRRRS
jgi:hypothetical protein